MDTPTYGLRKGPATYGYHKVPCIVVRFYRDSVAVKFADTGLVERVHPHDVRQS